MPFHQYFNGEIVPLDRPVFQTSDLGLLRGYGLFDFFRTYNGVPFRWDDYWQRFENSARLLKLPLPVTQRETEKILADLHSLSGEAEVAFRFVLTGGYAPDGVHVVQPNLLIRTEALPQDNPAGRLKGIKVLPYEYVRDLPEIKSTNYVHMVLMADEMKRQNAADLLFHKDGEVSELTRSNLFAFQGDKLITSDRNVLNGVTRRAVIELAKADFKVEIRPVTYKEVMTADEVFTTSTTKWVMPVVQIGDQPVANGLAGKRTLHLQKQFEDLVARWGK
ncbi:aminotransferase class IV [Dyadobacter jiangsuensis]|uniref:branched-chain-amino-acid transaminase n=1 Tax=Dyadobacter jiangsuensis TaxID=1591085 RepID=A0A2P8G605_9BACT|nr:aminotransferase class IV [Dyadobacter jiangsuensis]PSL29404.1 D-alanine transaminase/branched-chain amino acid aminotransferase [Dyadobacter jiangsuensis]